MSHRSCSVELSLPSTASSVPTVTLQRGPSRGPWSERVGLWPLRRVPASEETWAGEDSSSSDVNHATYYVMFN